MSLFLERGQLASSAVYTGLKKAGEGVSQVTVKRALSEMAEANLLRVSGAGPSTTYAITVTGRAYADVRAEE